jgi:hypothetical protein
MATGRLGQGRLRKQASIGDLVICIDSVRLDRNNHSQRFIGLVLDKSITVYKIKIVDTGKIVYWPMLDTYLWKEIR